jgi:NAD-dependent dihydropyrimidine dehydrogenase PreA subunit
MFICNTQFNFEKFITMKKINIKNLIVACLLFSIPVSTIISGCAASAKVAAKTGSQLWSENCRRCHNTPPATAFSADQWETIGLHMQSRALLTETEKNKIVQFLKGE